MNDMEYEVCIKRIDELEKRLDALFVIEKQNATLEQAFEVTVARYDDVKLEIDKLELENIKLEIANRKLTNALEATCKDIFVFDFERLSVGGLMGIAEILHNINIALGKEE